MEGKPYAFKSDVWALGCVMYEVLTGKPAFAANNFPGVAMKVLRLPWQYDILNICYC